MAAYISYFLPEDNCLLWPVLVTVLDLFSPGTVRSL